jgi:hypothetical protein
MVVVVVAVVTQAAEVATSLAAAILAGVPIFPVVFAVGTGATGEAALVGAAVMVDTEAGLAGAADIAD